MKFGGMTMEEKLLLMAFFIFFFLYCKYNRIRVSANELLAYSFIVPYVRKLAQILLAQHFTPFPRKFRGFIEKGKLHSIFCYKNKKYLQNLYFHDQNRQNRSKMTQNGSRRPLS